MTQGEAGTQFAIELAAQQMVKAAKASPDVFDNPRVAYPESQLVMLLEIAFHSGVSYVYSRQLSELKALVELAA